MSSALPPELEPSARRIREGTLNGDYELSMSVWMILQERPPVYFLNHQLFEEPSGFRANVYSDRRTVMNVLRPLGFSVDECEDGVERVKRPETIAPGWSVKSLAENNEPRPHGYDDRDYFWEVRVVVMLLGLFPANSTKIIDYPMRLKDARQWVCHPDPAIDADLLREQIEAFGGTIGKGGVFERLPELGSGRTASRVGVAVE